ncbi:DMT family transporter [Planomicrobium sp. CPCC 101110]|uniref:DMT family transporter n=1 Tax=Planomicrobium sp. CPCC 101110 TaxID=2599619 RepID=UPI0011B4D4AD|nr:DMT family transporter [Planomicrobium sp. CPCC 101110]TWT26008.1 DMT family transporter [Planomicrobium sp. CPCC 101110]
MKGILFALAGGFFLTYQSVANATISSQIGTWQAAAMTQLTGFLLAVLIVVVVGDRSYQQLNQVSPLYASGGLLAAIVLFNNMTAVHQMGVTLTIGVFLVAQLVMAIAIDSKGWFSMSKKRIGRTQIAGVILMVAGIIVLKW